MHHDWVRDLIEQHLSRPVLAVLAVPVHVLEIPAEEHNARADCVQLPDEGEKVAVAGDNNANVVTLVNCEFVGLKRQRWMNAGRTVFSQVIAQLAHTEFQKCVARYDGDRHLRSLSCWDQYLAMACAQLTYRESLRDIEACLRSMSGKLYHMGFRNKVPRSTLADANETHDWRIFADFAQHLIGIARPLHAEDPIGVDLDHSLYALDSTSIDLCLSLFPWAKFRQHKAAVKMPTLLDLHGNIPTFIRLARFLFHGARARRRGFLVQSSVQARNNSATLYQGTKFEGAILSLTPQLVLCTAAYSYRRSWTRHSLPTR